MRMRFPDREDRRVSQRNVVGHEAHRAAHRRHPYEEQELAQAFGSRFVEPLDEVAAHEAHHCHSRRDGRLSPHPEGLSEHENERDERGQRERAAGITQRLGDRRNTMRRRAGFTLTNDRGLLFGVHVPTSMGPQHT